LASPSSPNDAPDAPARVESDYRAETTPKRRMSDSELKALLDAEKVAALAAMQSSKLSSERDDALMYYMNDMSKDMPAQDGRSSAVSSDVADTIEGILPSLMDIFAGSEDVVKFNPVGPEDVQAALQETDYVNHVFMNENPGFLVLYSFIKDALLSKVGVVKCWWEKRTEDERETYYDLTDDQFAILVHDDDVEITKHTAKPVEDEHSSANQMLLQALAPQGGMPQQPGAAQSPSAPSPQLHDVEVVKRKDYAEAKVLGVPPEEFGIEKTARSLRDCNYCFHRTIQTQAKLIEQGYDPDQIRSLPTYLAITNAEEINRDTVAEHQNVGEEHNPASRRIQIIEHYVRMDYEGTGQAKLYKVTTGAEQGQLLYRNDKLDLEEFDMIPFAAMTPVIITHRFFGRSIADLVMDIQRIKTSLLRSLLDNAYLANNPRVEVAESHASENTLDDLLISRPGGIVRTKQPGGMAWQEVPTIGSHLYPLLEYQDATREQRTGVSRAGQALDPKSLQNTPAEAASQMFTLAQARMKLIARIFAETGVKDLFILLHGLIRKHGQEARTVRLRNQWVQVDPRDWKKRNDMTVEVGLGTGGKAEQMAMINLIIGMQEKALLGGMTNLVSPANLYNSAKQLSRIAGHKDVDAFFTDPSTQPPIQPKPDPKLQIEMIKIQGQQELQTQKQQTEAVHERAKLEADAALEQQKFQHEKEIALLEFGLKHEEMKHKMQLDTHKAQIDTHMAQQKMTMDAQGHQQSMELAEKKAEQPKAAIEVKHGADQLTGPLSEMLGKFGDHLSKSHEATTQAHQQHAQVMHEALKHISAPKRIIRDKHGKVSHLEAIT
jgi:hypothetical protein